MNLRLLLCIGFLLPLFAIGQDVTIDWGEDVESQTNVLKILGETENGHYALTNRKKDFFIERFSGGGMSRDFTKQIEFPQEGVLETELADIFYLDGTLVLFLVTYDRKEKLYTIYGYELNEKGGFTSNKRKIVSIEVEKKRRMGEFGFEVSRDRTKLLVYHSAPHKKQEKSWHVNMQLMTPDLQVIKEANEIIPLETAEEYIGLSDFVVGNDGAFYLATRNLDLVKGHLITKKLTVYQYAPYNGFNAVKIPIRLGNLYATSIALAIDPSGNVVGGGF